MLFTGVRVRGLSCSPVWTGSRKHTVLYLPSIIPVQYPISSKQGTGTVQLQRHGRLMNYCTKASGLIPIPDSGITFLLKYKCRKFPRAQGSRAMAYYKSILLITITPESASISKCTFGALGRVFSHVNKARQFRNGRHWTRALSSAVS
jgi:hypothetical protein